MRMELTEVRKKLRKTPDDTDVQAECEAKEEQLADLKELRSLVIVQAAAQQEKLLLNNKKREKERLQTAAH